MTGNIRKILVISLLTMLIVCIAIFSGVGIYMSSRSDIAINEIGGIYMSEMNRQLDQKFSVIINLHLSQVQGIIDRVSPETGRYGQQMTDDLILSARVRNFSYLALYDEDGNCDVICGEPVALLEGDTFLEDLAKSGRKVTSGRTRQDERVLLLGVGASYEMQDGGRSVALVAGLPMEYLGEVLVLDDNESLIYSHIIHKDGSFVIRSGDAYRENYFQRIRDIVGVMDGKDAEEYERELRGAIESDGNYTTLVMVEGVHRYLYCSSLPYCDWYLVSVMPYGVLDDAINKLGRDRVNTMIFACGTILAGVLIIFALYFRLSQQQMQQLDRAQREAVRANLAKSEFLSNMSHDIRTPMNGIVGMTAIAMANIQDTMRVQDCLKKITLSSRHLLGLINDVLDMSKIESGKLSLNMDQISLRETMDSIVNIVQPQIREKHQHFDIFIQKIETEDVYCDSVRLNQILINLLSNAIKFTPEHGRINVYLAQEDSPSGEAYVRCHFRVKDTGIGMSPEFREKIFETFTRETSSQVSKIEGTGLGMAITKCIVEAMGGMIEVESEPGAGSEFHVTLDLEKAVIKEEDMILPPWKMLVVDNNEELCISAVQALKEIGVEAEYALDGMTAVAMVEKRNLEHNDYEVVLIDWKMPDMDGVETTREIRNHVGDDVPILIISAYDWSDIEEEAVAAGAHGFISKPLFKSNLFLGLTRYMQGGPVVPEQQVLVEQQFGGKRILLAEDNDLNWEIAQEILTSAGFSVEWAENGQICVEKFQASEEGTYDLILMDIRMPVMTGYEAAKAIRALERGDAGLPIIAMTADAFSEDIQHCLDCGMNAHIAKPIDVPKLVAQLKKYLK